MIRRERPWLVLGVVLAAAVLALGFRAYLHPDMVIEFTNLLLCA